MADPHSTDFLRRAAAAREQIKEVTPREARLLLEHGARLVDVRERQEYEAGHLPGATQISGGTLPQQITTIATDHSQPLILYCASGNRSALATLELQNLAYSEVVALEGGIQAWNAEAAIT